MTGRSTTNENCECRSFSPSHSNRGQKPTINDSLAQKQFSSSLGLFNEITDLKIRPVAKDQCYCPHAGKVLMIATTRKIRKTERRDTRLAVLPGGLLGAQLRAVHASCWVFNLLSPPFTQSRKHTGARVGSGYTSRRGMEGGLTRRLAAPLRCANQEPSILCPPSVSNLCVCVYMLVHLAHESDRQQSRFSIWLYI